MQKHLLSSKFCRIVLRVLINECKPVSQLHKWPATVSSETSTSLFHNTLPLAHPTMRASIWRATRSMKPFQPTIASLHTSTALQPRVSPHTTDSSPTSAKNRVAARRKSTLQHTTPTAIRPQTNKPRLQNQPTTRSTTSSPPTAPGRPQPNNPTPPSSPPSRRVSLPKSCGSAAQTRASLRPQSSA